MANWYHADCFFLKFPPGTPSCPVSASTDIKGMHDLTWDDLIHIARDLLHEPEFSHGRTPSTRKLSLVRTSLRFTLDTLDIADLKRILENNGQRTKAGCGKRDVVRRCIDGMLYGALPKCPECGTEGTLYWDMDDGAYKCFADASEWAGCQFEMKDFKGLVRKKWEMIKELSGVKWLDEWVQPDDPENANLPPLDLSLLSSRPGNNTVGNTNSFTPFGIHSASTITPFVMNPTNTTIQLGMNAMAPQGMTPKSTVFKGMFVYISTTTRYLMRSESYRIEAAGGTVVRKFDKNIDLYVTRTRTSSRIELICDWYGVPVVTPEYFTECFNRNSLLDPAYFEPNQYIKTGTIKGWEGYVPVRERDEHHKETTKGSNAKVKLATAAKEPQEPKEDIPKRERSYRFFGEVDNNHENPDNEDDGGSEEEEEEEEGKGNITFANPGSYYTGSMYEPLKATQPSDLQQLCDISNFSVNKETGEEKDEHADPFTVYLAHYGQSDGIFLNPGSSEPVNLLGPKAIRLSKCDAPFEPMQKQEQQESGATKDKKSASKKEKEKVPVCKKAVNKGTGLSNRYHVMVADDSSENDGKDLYNAVLSSSDLSTQQNSYYYMQILEPDDKSAGLPYVVWMKWGRVGTTIGKSKVERTRSVGTAIKIFREKYREKTLNDWSMRKSFRKMPRAFYPLDVDYSDDDDDDENDANKPDYSIPSKLDKRVYRLIETLFDADKIRKEMASIGIDTTKMPLGKLRRDTVMSGYATLKEIESLISEGNSASKIRLLELSNKFYTIIPHSFGVGVSPPLINTKEILLSKMSMMETLADIEVAAGLMKDGGKEGGVSEPPNPIDAKYRRMHVELTPVEEGSSEWDFLRSAVRNTVPGACGFRLDLGQAFRVVREGEQERFEPYSYADGRRLLWHGSRLTNYVGILSQGLRIAPPEAPVSGYMFGKGIYLADMGGKSAEYCHATPESPSGIILLCEAALGTDPLRFKNAHYVEKSELERTGKESTMGLGRLNPAPHNNRVVKTKDGLLMKSGAVVAMGPEEPSDAGSDCELEHNEFIVYDVARVVIRYALEVNFIFADGWEARDITYGLK